VNYRAFLYQKKNMAFERIDTSLGVTRNRDARWLKSTTLVADAPGPLESISFYFQWFSVCKNVAPGVHST